MADVSLYEPSPNNNGGGNDTFQAGTNQGGKHTRGLVRFDVSTIPANASIKSASLTLSVVQAPFGPVNSTFDLHRMLLGWSEGTGTSTSGGGGRLAVAGETTWNNRIHPSTPWSAAGAAAPVDFSSTVSASKFIQLLGNYTFVSTAELVADVKGWVANSATNFGWIILTESEATDATLRQFASKEAAANRPTLVVEYVIPATPVIKSIQKVGSSIQFTFNALGGQPYTAEYSDTLAAGSWQTLTTISPQPTTADFTVTDAAPPASKRFYRITTTF